MVKSNDIIIRNCIIILPLRFEFHMFSHAYSIYSPYIHQTEVSMYVVEAETPVLSSQLYLSGGLVRCLSAYDNLTRVLSSLDVDLWPI